MEQRMLPLIWQATSFHRWFFFLKFAWEQRKKNRVE
jgi:hypothetical protein